MPFPNFWGYHFNNLGPKKFGGCVSNFLGITLIRTQEILYKFEISFYSVDQTVVLSDNKESFYAYAPAKRPLFVNGLIITATKNEILNFLKRIYLFYIGI